MFLLKYIKLDGRKIKEDSHEYLIKKLDLPDYYGRNLDALYDCLTDIGVETQIVLFNSEYVSLDLIDTFFDAALESDFLSFVCED